MKSFDVRNDRKVLMTEPKTKDKEKKKSFVRCNRPQSLLL